MIVLDSAKTTAALMVLVGFANLFSWIMAVEQIPQMIVDNLLGLTQTKYVLLILNNILLIFIGAFMETIAAMMILFPTLIGVTVQVGVDPVQFTIIMVMNLVIVLTTPPLRVCLFVA